MSPEGFEPLFFVPPRAQTNKTGTYEQQVVTRVAGYSWCLACAWHAAQIFGSICQIKKGGGNVNKQCEKFLVSFSNGHNSAV